MSKLFLLFLAIGLGSSLAAAQTACPVPSGAPTGTVAASHCNTLAWAASASSPSIVTGYNIFESASATGTFVQIGMTTALTYIDDGTQTPAVAGQIALNPGTTVFYYVEAYGPGGTSGPSNTVSATTPFPKPVAPGNLSVITQ